MPAITPARLREFFNPGSVALVGASDRNNMSLQVHTNLRMHGFRGATYYVNARADVVHGQPAVPSLSAIDGPVDLAFINIGGDKVLDLAEEAAAKGIRNIVILAGGFAEVDAAGAERQRRLIEIAERNDQLILGPNTIGFINLNDDVVLYGSPNPAPIKKGSVGVAVQSGVLLATTVMNLPQRGPGLSVLAAVANEAMISLDNMIDYFVEDEATKVIALFMETTRDPENFRRAVRRALEAGKPIVALAAARTSTTVDIAVSHTGALVGDQRVREAAFEELGIIMVKSLEEYLTTTALLANYGPLTGRRVAFTSISGGLCEQFADRAVEVGLQMPSFTDDTRAKLAEILPSFGATKNPLDYTGVAQSDPFFVAQVLDLLTQDPNLDMVVYGDNPSSSAPENLEDSQALKVAEAIGEVARRSPIPVLPAAPLYTNPHPINAQIAERTGSGFEIGGSEHGPRAIERSVWWSEQRAAILSDVVPVPAPITLPADVHASDEPWTEHRVLGLLDAAGVRAAPWALCAQREDAVAAAEKFGYPVVVKISSPDIAHKSRVGGVILGVTTAEAVADAYDAVLAAARKAHPDAAIDGVLVMPMRPAALELIVGVKRDRTWGHVLAIGFGGVWTEALADTALCLLPASPNRIAQRLRGLRGASMFAGGHGLPAIDLDTLAVQISRIADVAIALGDRLDSIEINPLRVDAEGAEALDGLVTWVH